MCTCPPSYLFAHGLFGKPVSTPDQVRGRLFPDHALLRQLLAEEGEHLAPAIHCLLRPVEWPVPIEDAVAGTVVAVERVYLTVLLELGLVLVHLLAAPPPVDVAEYAEQPAAQVLPDLD